jgi:hypothetical protein
MKYRSFAATLAITVTLATVTTSAHAWLVRNAYASDLCNNTSFWYRSGIQNIICLISVDAEPEFGDHDPENKNP